MKIDIGMYFEKYSWGLNILLLVLLAYLGARTTNTMVRSSYTAPASVEAWTPPLNSAIEAPSRPKIDAAAIESRNLFKAKIRDEEAPPPQTEEEVVETSRNFNLQGIIAGPKWRLATIENKDNHEKMVLGEGEEATPGVIIQAIHNDRVILAINGRQEALLLDYNSKNMPGTRRPQGGRVSPIRSTRTPPMPNAPGVKALSETEYVIDKDEFEAQLANINQLVTQARIVPNFTPDRQVDGFRIFQIHPGSIYQKLGLRNGDVIQYVNSIKMDDPTKGLELFQALKDQTNFTLDLKRRNQKMTFSYDVR